MIPAPQGYEPSQPPAFDGGSANDRDHLLKLYYNYWVCNDVFDGEALAKIWDPAPENVFFNTNGHTYHGLKDWLHIWDHYRARMKIAKRGGTGAIRITIRGDMALITDEHMPRFWQWLDAEQPDFLKSKPYCRATMVCLKEPKGWQTIHVHFSMGRPGPRPDQGGPD